MNENKEQTVIFDVDFKDLDNDLRVIEESISAIDRLAEKYQVYKCIEVCCGCGNDALRKEALENATAYFRQGQILEGLRDDIEVMSWRTDDLSRTVSHFNDVLSRIVALVVEEVDGLPERRPSVYQ